jgi:hypothetical protein
MGNGCACNTDTIQITKIFVNRNQSNKIINLDTDFCLKYQIGPFFGKTNNSFKAILKRIKYNKQQIEINILYNTDNYTKLKLMLTETFCKNNLFLINNNAFRAIFYIIILERIKVTESSDLILKENDNETSKLLKQIDCDIPRTFPNLSLLKDDIFISALRDNLMRIAMAEKELGYVQGINFIVSYLQIVFGNNSDRTVETFLKLMNMESLIFSQKFKHVLTAEFKLLYLYLDKFKELLGKININLHDKIYSIQLSEFTWISKWIQTIFIYNFRLDIAVRLFDIIVHNVDLILLVSLAITQYCSKELMRVEEIEGLIKVFNKVYNLPENKIENFINYIINYINQHLNFL